MRIAGPRPTAFAIPVATTALYAAAGILAVALAVLVATGRIGRSGDAPRDEASAMSMADAFGLGGLASLRAPADAKARPSPVDRATIVTYYGSPNTPSMGILGQHEPEEVAALLAERARHVAEADPSAHVLPALHVVYAVAQPERDAGGEGLYLRYLDDRTVRRFISLARRNGFAVVLDLQIGHSDPLTEVRKILPYLEEPDVFVALDPEFALSGNTLPGQAIGSIDASEINAVQWYLAKLAEQRGLPEKMLIVHQFQAEMITDAGSIERRDDVDLVINMDGYGPADIKEVKYQRYAAAQYAPFGGIKVFLEHDPDPLSERDLLGLQPRPSLLVYQ